MQLRMSAATGMVEQERSSLKMKHLYRIAEAVENVKLSHQVEEFLEIMSTTLWLASSIWEDGVQTNS